MKKSILFISILLCSIGIQAQWGWGGYMPPPQPPTQQEINALMQQMMIQQQQQQQMQQQMMQQWQAQQWSAPMYVPDATVSPSGNSNDYWDENNRRERNRNNLNRTVGEDCSSCGGSGKCHACNGTKVASSFGNTYKCTVCDANGNCPVCHGTGKASWNR